MNEQSERVVAIVDDEAIIRKSLEIILLKRGYSVISAKSGEKLLEVIKTKPADVYIIDLDLPGIDGGELSYKIIERQSSAKIIILSGFPLEGKHDLSKTRNFVCSLLKPVDIDLLFESVQKAISFD